MGKHIAEHSLKTSMHVMTSIARPISSSKRPEGVLDGRIDYCGNEDSALAQVL